MHDSHSSSRGGTSGVGLCVSWPAVLTGTVLLVSVTNIGFRQKSTTNKQEYSLSVSAGRV